MAADEFTVEISVGVCAAVRCDQQLCAVKVWRTDRCKLDLYRPLCQFGTDFSCRLQLCASVCICLSPDGSRLTSRTSAWCLCRLFALFMFFHCLLIISCCLTLHKMDRIYRTGRQTVAETVTIIIAHKLRFSIHHCDCSFMACLCAKTTSYTCFLVDLYNSSYHLSFLLLSAYLLFVSFDFLCAY